jgi:hypothetical protein
MPGPTDLKRDGGWPIAYAIGPNGDHTLFLDLNGRWRMRLRQLPNYDVEWSAGESPIAMADDSAGTLMIVTLSGRVYVATPPRR